MGRMKTLPLVDGPVTFAGAVSLEIDERGVLPWRLPLPQRDLFEAALLERARMAAGVRLTLRSDTASIELAFDAADQQVDATWRFDLVVDGRRHVCLAHPRGPGRVRFDDLPAGEHDLELWLPQFGAIRIRSLAIDDGATAAPLRDDRPRWVCYGSSITQCRTAAGPTETWPALVARQFDLNLTCLGFGGQCKLDPTVARVIRDLPADYISVCLGINVHGGDYSPRTFGPAVLGVLLTIRDGHPRTPLACVSPICSPPRETTPGLTGMTLQSMRTTIRETVQTLRDAGDRNLHYIDGLTLFGADLAHHMPDELHPHAEGYRVLARQYAQVVMPALSLAPLEVA